MNILLKKTKQKMIHTNLLHGIAWTKNTIPEDAFTYGTKNANTPPACSLSPHISCRAVLSSSLFPWFRHVVKILTSHCAEFFSLNWNVGRTISLQNEESSLMFRRPVLIQTFLKLIFLIYSRWLVSWLLEFPALADWYFADSLLHPSACFQWCSHFEEVYTWRRIFS